MAQGNATGTSASVVMLAADEDRGAVTLTLTNATAAALGVGVAAVADEGLLLIRTGDTIEIEGPNAREAIYIIGNGAIVAYQTGGPIRVARGPNPLPSS